LFLQESVNWRKNIYFSYSLLRGYRFPKLLAEYWREHESARADEITRNSLARLFEHCRGSVPYYAKLFRRRDCNPSEADEPMQVLERLPILRKETIRANFADLQSADLHTRSWIYNTSGGSTGEPIQLIQDSEYRDRSRAITLLYCRLLGCELGNPLLRVWGSEAEVESTLNWKSRLFDWLQNTVCLNAFQMTTEGMRAHFRTINRRRPKLILGYAQCLYELALFAERERIQIDHPPTVVTSAGTLYEFMRKKIARVFGGPVYNLYGSREVSDVACEVPDCQGLWVAPWGNYVEIVDERGEPIPPGTEGNIVITCLTNHAMPLIRYWIGDRGALLPAAEGCRAFGGQVLKQVLGRTVDVFRRRDQTLIDGEYFTHLLYFRPWVSRFQVVQKDYESVLFKIVRPKQEAPKAELQEIARKTRLVMGNDCNVEFEFAKDLPPQPNGKYRYTISELTA
jgi:phenylacetate-CoA ligase